jgi:hypothetical protein
MPDKLGLGKLRLGRLLRRALGRDTPPAPDPGDVGTAFGMELALGAEHSEKPVSTREGRRPGTQAGGRAAAPRRARR